MRRYLLVALWPAGVAAITAATASAARRASRDGVSRAAGVLPAGINDLGDTAAVPLPLVSGARRLGPVLARSAMVGGQGSHGTRRWPSGAPARPDWLPGLIRLGAFSCAAGALSYGVMTLLGPAVVNRGPAIDEPIVRWTSTHQVDWWAAVIERLGKIGNTWTTWGAAATAAVCLGTSWRKHKWLPPAALGAAILVDHYVTLALRHKFGRLGPPGSPGGTYPSGGCDRVVFLYGLIAYMLWREFSGSESGRIWAIGAVTALSFNEAYSRQYLSKHWFTDIVSGLLYGAVLLAPFIAGVRLIAGPPSVMASPGMPALMPVKAA